MFPPFGGEETPGESLRTAPDRMTVAKAPPPFATVSTNPLRETVVSPPLWPIRLVVITAFRGSGLRAVQRTILAVLEKCVLAKWTTFVDSYRPKYASAKYEGSVSFALSCYFFASIFSVSGSGCPSKYCSSAYLNSWQSGSATPNRLIEDLNFMASVSPKIVTADRPRTAFTSFVHSTSLAPSTGVADTESPRSMRRSRNDSTSNSCLAP